MAQQPQPFSTLWTPFAAWNALMIAGLHLKSSCTHPQHLAHQPHEPIPQSKRHSNARTYIQPEHVVHALVDLGQGQESIPVGIELLEDFVPQRLVRLALPSRKLRPQLSESGMQDDQSNK